MSIDKEVDWMLLSHCDGQAVRQLIEYDNREAMTVLRLRPRDAFMRDCQKNAIASRCFEVCLGSYRSLSGKYAIQHDAYGGYGLVYVGQGWFPKTNPDNVVFADRHYFVFCHE